MRRRWQGWPATEPMSWRGALRRSSWCWFVQRPGPLGPRIRSSCAVRGRGTPLVLWAARIVLQRRFFWSHCPVVLVLAALFLLAVGQITALPRPVLATLSPGTARLYDRLLPAQPEVLPGDVQAALCTARRLEHQSLSGGHAVNWYRCWRCACCLPWCATTRFRPPHSVDCAWRCW